MSIELEQIPPVIFKSGRGDFPGDQIIGRVDARERDLSVLAGRFPSRNIDIKTILRQPGATVYMPLGEERVAPKTTPKALYRETRYLPKRWHREVMRASAWELVAKPYLDALAEMNYYGVGLSVGAAMLWGAAKFGAIDEYTIGDPDTMDGVVGGRHVFWEPSVTEWNKTEVASRALLSLDPYVTVRKFKKGLTPTNAQRFFHGINRKPSVIVQEVDDPPTKDLAHSMVNATRIQIGDVGRGNVTVTIDKPGDPAFNGRTQGKQGMDALLASIDDRVGEDFKALASRIGKDKEITTVPQDFGAVLLAAAVARQYLPHIAAGEFDKVPRIATLNISENLKIWEH